MSSTIDLTNKETKKHIAESLALPRDHHYSPWVNIPLNQFQLYLWSKAYEEMDAIVTDSLYDMQVRYLQRLQTMYPEVWEECCFACFRDGSWEFTGMFITDHDPDDEEWLL